MCHHTCPAIGLHVRVDPTTAASAAGPVARGLLQHEDDDTTIIIHVTMTRVRDGVRVETVAAPHW